MKRAILISFIAAITAVGADGPAPTPDAIAKTYATALARLTGKPKAIGPEFATLCNDLPAKEKYGPHAHHYVHHYRNESAKLPAEKFAAGSVLVKEKLELADTKDPSPVVTLVTGMIKQPAGTSPKTGDWQFFVLRDGKVETAKMESCAGCHSGAKRDYVFTDLPKR